MSKATGPRRRTRGAVDRLPSGAYRVRVYAGLDPVTGQRNDLIEIVPPGPNARNEAEKIRTRFLHQIDEHKNARTKATVGELLDEYFAVLDVAENTRDTYLSLAETHIRPVLGALPVAKVNGQVLDSFYAQLRRCRVRCDGKRGRIDHRVPSAHVCDDRCSPHVCRPLSAATVRKIHWTLSGAMERAVRWNWIAVNPTELASAPPPPRPRPQPPSPQATAKILEEAWKDAAWGTFLWLAVTTGARRGELCALRREDLDLDGAVLTVDGSVYGTRQRIRRKDTKTHQRRRIALDPETVTLLRQHLAAQDDVAAQCGFRVAADAFLFSSDPDCAEPWLPGSVSQRYDRMVERLGIHTSLHKLRHFNATEMIAAGVDLRTVAGRLGHSGGTTTLRAYAAWVAEADRRPPRPRWADCPRRPGGARHDDRVATRVRARFSTARSLWSLPRGDLHSKGAWSR